MASKQELLHQNKKYEEALIWFETQSKYKIDAEMYGKNVKMKLLKDGVVVKETIEPFDANYHIKIQDKIIALYNYNIEQLKAII